MRKVLGLAVAAVLVVALVVPMTALAGRGRGNAGGARGGPCYQQQVQDDSPCGGPCRQRQAQVQPPCGGPCAQQQAGARTGNRDQRRDGSGVNCPNDCPKANSQGNTDAGQKAPSAK